MTTPKRPPIPKPTQRSILTKNLSVCCVCKERGIGTNFHHIDSNPANNAEDNIALLCVKEHDQHHRPHSYAKTKHLELGADKLREFKCEWEQTVAECKSEFPNVIADVNCFGTDVSIHSVRLIVQNDKKIIYERNYHLLTGTPDQWIDAIIDEVGWLGKNIKLAVVDEPVPIEYCPCCANSFSSNAFSHVLDKNVVTRLTVGDWKENSIGTIYINPTFPSLALTVFYKDEVVFSASLHKCGRYLHFVCDNYEERTPIKKSPSIRTQATEIMQKVVSIWETGRLLIGTGDHDSPTITNKFHLPKIWEKKNSR